MVCWLSLHLPHLPYPQAVQRRYLKQVRKSKANPSTHFTLVSTNEEFDDMELLKTKIKAMWLIHGWINKNT